MKNICAFLLLFLLCSCAGNQEIIPVDTTSQKVERLDKLADLKKESHLSKYLFSRTQQETLVQVGKIWDERLGLLQDCKENPEVIALSFMLLEPIVLPEDKTHPTAGAWQHRFAFKRCGEQKIYNAVFVSENGEQPKVIPYFPGTTSASGQLLSDTLTSALMVAIVKLNQKSNKKNCRDLKLIDTELEKPPHDVIENGKTTKGVWNEKWTLRGCEETVKVAVTFIPDGRGGTSFTVK